MNKHSLNYIQMYPQAVEEPSDGTVLLWAAFVIVAVYLLAIVLFSL